MRQIVNTKIKVTNNDGLRFTNNGKNKNEFISIKKQNSLMTVLASKSWREIDINPHHYCN